MSKKRGNYSKSAQRDANVEGECIACESVLPETGCKLVNLKILLDIDGGEALELFYLCGKQCARKFEGGKRMRQYQTSVLTQLLGCA